MDDDKIIILKINGGLGNQLFQIANAFQLSKKFNRKLFISDKNPSSRKSYWDSIFLPIKSNLITNDQYNKLREKSNNYNWAARRFEFKEIILDSKINCYNIDGYYQSYKYFDIEYFKKYLNLNYNQDKYVINSNDVAVHIRRTDYTKHNSHKLLSLNYYYNCIKDIQKKKNINNIYIFSDDINWCKNNFKWENVSFVHLNNEINEFVFMTKFNNIIMANSSFSWWCAYLSNAEYIYSPKNWFIKGCRYITRDLQPNNWIIIDDELQFRNVSIFSNNNHNIISLGHSCSTIKNINENVFKDTINLRRDENATNFFDWTICDFKAVIYIFEKISKQDYSFLNNNNFTLNNVRCNYNDMTGGWKRVYNKVEFKDELLVFLHDVNKEKNIIPNDFFDKYKRRIERLESRIKQKDSLHFIHVFDFQWFNPYFPEKHEIELFFNYCKIINSNCDVHLYFLIHPDFANNELTYSVYQQISNLHLYYLKDKGGASDWKAFNLSFDDFFNSYK